jgi:hypothetical protein
VLAGQRGARAHQHSTVTGGRIISFGNNAVHGNNTDGAPTATVL